MKEKIITKTYIEGDIKFDGRVIFENSVEITGSLKVGEVDAKGNARNKGVQNKMKVQF